MHDLADTPQATNTKLTLGARLRHLRTATGCTVAEIAAATGIDVKYIAMFEEGYRPGEESMWRLARVYGVSLDDLVTQTPPAGPGGRSSSSQSVRSEHA